MRTLHLNSRVFQEPFLLLQIDNRIVKGIDKWSIKNKVLMYGSIMSKTLTIANSFQDTSNSILSIKTPYQLIEIKPNDRIVVNDKQYLVIECERNYYNKNEIIIKCSFEKYYDIKTSISKLNCKLNCRLAN